MSADRSNRAALAVMTGYDLAIRSLEPLANAGGFSGARIWRVETQSRTYCLKSWPPSRIDSIRLSWIHDRLTFARSCGIEFLPSIARRRDGLSCSEFGERVWDLIDWMPGIADFQGRPTAARMASAMSALAQLHRVWRQAESGVGPCPSITRRLERVNQWEDLLRRGWRPNFLTCDVESVGAIAKQAWPLILAHVPTIRNLLSQLLNRQFRLQTCLGDIWHDHVLFKDDRVVGIIDFGSVRVDSPAVDLARLLGSFAPLDDSLYLAGLNDYRSHAPLSDDEVELTRILDYAGTVLGAANWLLWIYHDGRVFEDLASAAARLTLLVRRMEAMNGPGRILAAKP
jgi:Ser/Thr protein kinase RdoA (MazF antagonist)